MPTSAKYSLPPTLDSSVTKNQEALRNYLVRLVSELNQIENVATTQSNGELKVVNGKKVVVNNGNDTDINAVIKNSRELRALIIKTAQDLGLNITDGDSYVMQYTDNQINGLNADLKELYVARSEYGQFVESINTQIETTARGVVESYNYASAIQSNQTAINLLQEYTTTIDGQIRRGIVVDPTTQMEVLGIAISQNLQFTGSIKKGDDGYTYYYLQSGQTFGLYTATGWQFWIDGYKKGWYNSVDGMLHIENLLVESTLQIGANFQFVIASNGGLGLKKLTTAGG